MSEYLKISLNLVGRELDMSRAEPLLVKEKGAVRYRDAFHIKFPEGEAWLFEYGALVGWNLSEDDRRHLVGELDEVLIDREGTLSQEVYRYHIDPNLAFSVKHDVISLPNDDHMTRLALSHAFAQSHKLSFFEARAQEVISKNNYISKQLAHTGKIPLKRRELARLRGVLFDTSSDITLHFNLLDTPEFFWDYPEQETYYQALAKYLDLSSRIHILNHKLSTIHEMLDMLSEEQKHKHSAFLEWIIIVLIAIDILIYMLPN